MKNRIFSYVSILIIGLMSCTNSVKNKANSTSMDTTYTKGQYGYDRQFLNKYLKPIELKKGDATVLLSAEYQGRVLTSSSDGSKGFSYGWINYELIESGKILEHMNAFGGEERLWLGPEGGQFSIFFAKGAPFDEAHWFTPKCIDTEPFDVVASDSASASFTKKFKLVNYSGFRFDVEINRKVRILSKTDISEKLNVIIPKGLKVVAYESDNLIKNLGEKAWTKETGALSIWLLGMMTPSTGVTVVIPYKTGDLGTVVKDDYFGKVPADRLIVSDKVIYFKADGKKRSKIGISPKRALPLIGSYDAVNKILTILETTIDSKTNDYVNSAWEIQKNPYGGDVINSYNDGPMADGTQMGSFYELESSSKAAFLKPNEKLVHIQRTYHFEGDEKTLSEIALQKLGVSIQSIQSVFEK